MKMNPAHVYQTVKIALVVKGVESSEAEQRTRAKAGEAMALADASLLAAIQKMPGKMWNAYQEALTELAAWAAENA